MEMMRVVMMPHLAHGHISRFFELAKRLSNKGFQIYFYSTPICLEPIRNNNFDDSHYYKHSSSSNIQLIDLHFPPSFLQDLPPHYHSTKNIPPLLMNTLLAALDATKSAFSDLLKNLKPHLIIYDIFQPWAPQVARDLNVQAVLFLTGVATQNLSIGATQIKMINRTVNGITIADRFHRSVISSNVILVKSAREIQAKLYKDGNPAIKDVVVVGPIVQKPQECYDEKIMNWLSEKEESSVVFVSLGSENFFCEEEMEEMAKGLELSGVDFIWAVRFHGESEIRTIDEALPGGFLERTKGRGLVVNWAPQAKVLSHTSVGGFVSHCGWNSALESMYYGVPVIGIPVKLDQPFNAKMVVEMGVGVEVRRHDGKFVREEVGNVVRRVMVEEEGKEVRQRAKELSERLKETEEEEFDEAVVKLLDLVQQSSKSSSKET